MPSWSLGHKQVGALLEPGSESLMRGGTHLELAGRLLLRGRLGVTAFGEAQGVREDAERAGKGYWTGWDGGLRGRQAVVHKSGDGLT